MLAVRKAAASSAGAVNVRVEDDALPANAKQSADRMVQSGVRLFTGVNFERAGRRRARRAQPAASTSA